jgi:hypothetical protein
MLALVFEILFGREGGKKRNFMIHDEAIHGYMGEEYRLEYFPI